MRFDFGCLMIIFLALLFLTGCAAFLETFDEVKNSPEVLKSEAETVAAGTQMAFPGLPYIACLGIGYLISFARRMYKNYKKKEAEAKTTI